MRVSATTTSPGAAPIRVARRFPTRVGAAYHQAYERGVKLIGATAHFVTADLDEGPIIEQDVARVTHARRPTEFIALGRDVERTVLARAVGLIAEDRVMLVGQRTVIFSQ